MPNDITIINNTTTGNERWDVSYIVDQSGSIAKTLNTAGTFLDRNIQISISTPPANFAISGATIYCDSAGWVSQGSSSSGIATINSGAIKSGTATISLADANVSYNSTSGKFDISKTGTVSAPTVTTDGYVSSSVGTKSTNTATASGALNKISIAASMTGTAKVTPSISKITTASGNSATNITAAVSAATTTKPTSGYYVAVQSAAAANTITATPSVSSAGYGTTSYYGSTNATLSVGANNSAVTYLPVTAAAGSVTLTTTLTKKPAIARSAFSLTGVVDAASGAATTTQPNSGVYVKVKSSANTDTTTATAKITTAGYTPTNNSFATSSAATYGATASDDTYIPITTTSASMSEDTVSWGSGWITAGSLTLDEGSYSADSSAYTNSTVTPSVSINNASTYGFTTSTPSGTNGTNYLTIDPGATATAWSVTPRANITVAGYISFGNKNGSAVSYTPSISEGANYYIPIVTPTFAGGDLNNKAATAAFANANNKVVTAATTDDYNNGLTVLAKGTAGRDAVTYTNSAGAIAAHSGTSARSALAADTWNGTTYYLKGVKLAAPSSGLACFDIAVPNGNTTDFITFHFEVDSSGNVLVTDTHTI